MGQITTYTGKRFDPINPDKNMIDIRDIAHALSLTCRGNGHVKNFFSVGQHCVYCAKEAETRGYSGRVILGCLLHDASEAYMSDVPRPFKAMLPEYQKLEDKLCDLIYGHFLGSRLTEEEQIKIKEIDDDVLYFDLRELLNIQQEGPVPKMHIEIEYSVKPFEEIEQAYIEIFNRYIKFNRKKQ